MKCPSDTRSLFNENNIEISNFALRYRYFLEHGLDANGRIQFGLQFQQLNQTPGLAASQEVLEPLRDRQTEQLQHLASSGHFYCATSRMDWRMVVGLGSDHVQETNMTLDHVYGIPYLPGSAFKGIVRSWVIQKCFENDENLATREIENGDPADLKEKKERFFLVFGSQKSAGRVRFLDALPNSGVHFDIDIMNPHFSDYYIKGEFPTDYQKLIQIYFLTLKNTHFRFLMVAKAAKPLQLAKDWFTQAIVDRGFGAKSAVGYGYFRELNDITEDLRYEFAEKLSLEKAYDIYQNYPNRRAFAHINIEDLVNYASKFAVIVTEEICEVNSIGGVNDIPKDLIEVEDDMVIPSKFGKWVWESSKDKLFEEILPPFPNLAYRSQFNRTLENLSVEDRKLLQENLLQIAVDFRRAFNTNLPLDERELLIERLLQVADNLTMGKMFANSSTIDRESLAEKLLEIAANLEAIEDIPESIDVEGGRKIQCGNIENSNLVLRSYTSQ